MNQSNYRKIYIQFWLWPGLVSIFRNLVDIKQDSDAEYKDEETADVDTKDETAPFGKKISGIREQLVRAFPELQQVSCTSHS